MLLFLTTIPWWERHRLPSAMDIPILCHQMTSSDLQWLHIGIGQPRYEEEHDPWNAHLRSTNSASSSGTVSYTSQTGAQTYSSHSWSHRIFGDAPTATRLTDAMTCRYSQVDVQNSEQIRPQPHQGTEDTTAMSPTEGNFCDCSSTCNYCSSRCCLRKRGHTVHLCLIHKIP